MSGKDRSMGIRHPGWLKDKEWGTLRYAGQCASEEIQCWCSAAQGVLRAVGVAERPGSH